MNFLISSLFKSNCFNSNNLGAIKLMFFENVGFLKKIFSKFILANCIKGNSHNAPVKL